MVALSFLPLAHAHKRWDRLLPLLISRLMLSLKKASRDKNSGWTSDALSRVRTCTQMEFVPPSDGTEDGVATRSDELAPSDPGNTQAREKSEEEKV
jgi:hypothetical protein